jgi:hypothetical protein
VLTALTRRATPYQLSRFRRCRAVAGVLQAFESRRPPECDQGFNSRSRLGGPRSLAAVNPIKAPTIETLPLPGQTKFTSPSAAPRDRAPSRNTLTSEYLRDSGPLSFITERERKACRMFIALSPVVSLVAGILILIFPRLLNFIVAIHLIIVGILGLMHR